MTEKSPFDSPVPTLVVKAHGFAELTPLERAARALAMRNDGHEARWDSWEGDARAVLEAVREPSEEMKMAGVIAPNYLEDQSSKKGCTNIFKAMIDAALSS